LTSNPNPDKISPISDGCAAHVLPDWQGAHK
jgi:hypothetical protein